MFSDKTLGRGAAEGLGSAGASAMVASGRAENSRITQEKFLEKQAAVQGLFALLAVGNIAGNEAIIHVAGWIGLVCGASAIYLAMGEVLNEQFGRTILPIGEAH